METKKKTVTITEPDKKRKKSSRQENYQRSGTLLNKENTRDAFDNWEQLKPNGHMEGRAYHLAWVHNNIFYMYGGYEINKSIMDDFYCVDVSKFKDFTWEKVQLSESNKTNPGTLITPSIHLIFQGVLYRGACVQIGDYAYIYGGQCSSIENTNALFRFDCVQKLWEEMDQKSENPKDKLPSIDSHSMVASESGDTIYTLCGFIGADQGVDTSSVHKYDIESQVSTCLFDCFEINPEEYGKTCPCPRNGQAAYIVQENIFMFGGSKEINRLGDFWQFNLQNNQWTQLKFEQEHKDIPCPRNGHSFIRYKSALILFGGIRELTHERNDIWMFNLHAQKWAVVERASSVRILKKKRVKSSQELQQQREREEEEKMRKELEEEAKKSEKKFHVSSKNQYKELMKEKTEKMQIMKKHLMLKELEVDPKDLKSFKTNSPTTQSMKNSIIALGIQTQLNPDSDEEIQEKTVWQKRFRIQGLKPQARDGHTATLFENQMLIFGGDRHQMSFHDLFAFKLDSISGLS